jgi:hypothetical protein
MLLMPNSLLFHKIIGYFCETKIKSIKKTAKILSFSIAGIVLFFALLYILLQNGKIQNYLAQTIVKELSVKLHTKVSVGKVEYKLFNVLSLNELYVEDLQKDTLLYVKEADAHFNFWKFFKGKIIFTSVDIDQLTGNIVIDKAGHSNLDFVINAFKSPPKADTTHVEYRIKHFKLQNSNFSYRDLRVVKNLPKAVFNAADLRLKHINLEFALNVLKKDTFNAEVFGLSATDKSGLEITNMEMHLFGSKTGIIIPGLLVELPKSKLKLEDIELKYDSLADLKKIGEKVRWKAPIVSSYVALSDLKAFVPEFRNVKGVAQFNGLLSGRISNMRFQKMEIKYGNSLRLRADLDINGLPNLSEAFIYGQINELSVQPKEVQDFVSQMSGKPFVLPRELDRLGKVKYKGNITGFLSNLVAYGNLNTNVGSISTDILLKLENDFKDLVYNGTIKTSNLQLGKLLNNPQLGNVVFNFNTKGSKRGKMPLQGVITAKVPELQFNKYQYRDIQFDGKYDGKGFNGKVEVDDDNIHAQFNGMIDLTHKLPVLDFELKLLNTNLNALHLMDKYKGATLSFNGKTKVVGNSLDNLNGFVRFDSIVFKNKGKTLNTDKIQLISRIDKTSTNVSVISDYINGTLNGNFKYSTIGFTVNNIIRNYLPSLANTKSKKMTLSNHIDIDLTVANTKDISDVLELPYTLEGVSTVKGEIDERKNNLDVVANFPLLYSSKQRMENLSLHCENLNKKLQLTARTLLQEKTGLVNVFATAAAANDSVSAQLVWQNTQKTTNAGDIHALAGFKRVNGKLAAKIDVLPSQLIVNDSIWNLHPSSVEFNADSTIRVNNFRLDSHKQFVQINGLASSNLDDHMLVTMNDLNLDFVFGLLKLKSIYIGGRVTGTAALSNLLKQPIYEANLSVKGVTLNHKPIGDATITSSWDKENSQVLANARFVNEKNELVTTVGGVYVPKNDSLDFTFDAERLNMEFLNRYFESVVSDFKGYASGKIRMLGPSRILGFQGDVLVHGGQATIKMLKTTYSFNDSVHLTRKSIHLKNIRIYDEERNPGTLNGLVKHNGLFSQMEYNVNVSGKNIMAMNTHAQDNDYFFGKAYANGNVHIHGDEKVCSIDVLNAVSQPKTKCFINMGSASKASNNNSFINFVNKNTVEHKEVVVPKAVATPNAFNVKINLQLDVTPDAEMELIVDPKGGDVITGRGNGNLRVEFDSFSDVKLYGTYVIDNGYYLFTMQNLIKKEFKIDKGSTLAWTGDPYNAQVNVRALYPLSASLKDLDKNMLTQNRTTVPVNCVLKLTDNLMKPTINFDVDLPQCDESVKQRVKNIINTEEMMNKQILYLLVFGRFYTPEYAQNTSTTTNSVVPTEAISFGLSTFSSQINSWISRASKDFTIGFDVKTSNVATNETQYSTQMLYQPNNRLIINGNFGYSNENANASTNNNKFIGDVDVEYLLTESGKLRLKAYNHTVDRYRLTTAKTTQGVGVLYKEDFTSVSDMFKYYWRMLTGSRKNKVNDETETN